MESLQLRASDLRNHAAQLIQAQHFWEGQWNQLSYHWQLAQDQWRGSAAYRAQQRLRHFHLASQQQAGILRRLSAVLITTISPAQLLEELWQRLLLCYQNLQHWNQYVIDESRIISALLRDVQKAGLILDEACARQISAVSNSCAHQSYAPGPSKEEILATYPDATILEHSEKYVVVAFGDLAQASDITTVVAGVGSADPQRWMSNIGRAEYLTEQTSAATIAWLSYDAPPNVTGGIAQEPAVVGAQRLRKFQDQLRADWPHASLHVLGHSYGSTVAGVAAREGLAADSLILVGSPGVPDHLELHGRNRQPGQIVGVVNNRDPIGIAGTNQVALHGIDPGARAQGRRSPIDSQWFLRGDHSSYFEDPEFLAALRKHYAQH
ncbi:MAG: alpha/beta hydrolase [Corynebacterium sp.]|nr:alpha/beta hydrolase [Corynebacterium sp.]